MIKIIRLFFLAPAVFFLIACNSTSTQNNYGDLEQLVSPNFKLRKTEKISVVKLGNLYTCDESPSISFLNEKGELLQSISIFDSYGAPYSNWVNEIFQIKKTCTNLPKAEYKDEYFLLITESLKAEPGDLDGYYSGDNIMYLAHIVKPNSNWSEFTNNEVIFASESISNNYNN